MPRYTDRPEPHVRAEGLLEANASGGYIVSAFTEQDVFDSIELRGTLEGLAARFAAERGIPKPLDTALARCISELDGAVAEFAVSYDCDRYVTLNDQFHNLLVEASQSPMIRRSLDRILALPFAAPNAFVQSSRSQLPEAATIMATAQEQHRSILEAIRHREGRRAEALACEHSRSAWKYLRMALSDNMNELPFPGRGLIQPNAPRR